MLEFIFVTLYLFIGQVFAYCAMYSLDYYIKVKGDKYKLKKCSKFTFRCLDIKKDYISVFVLCLKITNYVYIFLYLLIEFVNCFICSFPKLSLIAFNSNLIYGALAVFTSLVFLTIAVYLKGKKDSK